MSPRRVWAILRKDLFDAIRDGRVLAIIIVPIALGVLYSVIYPDEEPRPTATVAVVGGSADAQRVARALPRDVHRSLDLTVTRKQDPRTARAAVADGDADVAVLVPHGLVDRAHAGRAPPLRVLVAPDASPAARAVIELLPATIGRLADRPPAVRAAPQAVTSSSPSAFKEIGPRHYFVLAAIVMVLGFIGMLATPIILAEEIEKRTIEALLLAARGSEVLTAKALVGLAYSAVATAITLLLTGVPLERPLLFVFGAVGTALALVGLGLVLAYLFRSADKLNTWGWVLLMPLLAPAFVIAVPMASWLSTLLALLPTSQGMKMMADGTLPHDVFGGAGWALLVFAVWGAGGLLVLARLLQRRGR